MLLTELAVQNLAGFPPATRLSLRRGLNALVTGDVDAIRVIRAVLFPDPLDSADLCAGPGPHKAALTIVGNDGHTYRLIRDFAGERMLLRSDPKTRQAVHLSDDPAEVTRLLRTAVGMPVEELFLGHIAISAGNLPSRLRPVPPSPPSEVSGTAEPPPSFSLEEARVRHPELRLELEQAHRFEREQDRVFELQTRLTELEGSTRSLEVLERKIQGLDRRLQGFQAARDIARQAEPRIKRYSEAESRRDAALKELETKREALEEAIQEPLGLSSFFRDRLVAGGLAMGVLAIIAAIALGMRSLLLLDVIAFSVAAIGAWRWVDRAEEADESVRKLEGMDELKQRILKQYESETRPVHEAMKVLGVDTPEAVLEALEEHDKFQARRMAYARELETLRNDPEYIELERQRSAVETELREREARVHSMGFTRDIASIRRDLEACEEALGLTGNRTDVLVMAVTRAAILSRQPVAKLLEHVADRLRQYLSALTGRRYVGVRPVPTGLFVVAANGASGPLAGLSPADQDAIALAVRLALFEKVGAIARFPLLIDDPRFLVEPSVRGLLVKMLRSLGALNQVVIRAVQVPPAGAVDHVAVWSHGETTPPLNSKSTNAA